MEKEVELLKLLKKIGNAYNAKKAEYDQDFDQRMADMCAIIESMNTKHFKNPDLTFFESCCLLLAHDEDEPYWSMEKRMEVAESRQEIMAAMQWHKLHEQEMANLLESI